MSSAYASSVGVTFGNAHAVQAANLVNSMLNLKANVQRGQSPSTVETVGGSFVTLAAQYYGDPSLAQPLAKANGANSIRLPSNRKSIIVLPPLIATSAAT